MKRRFLFMLIFAFPVWVFAQQTPAAGTLRDYGDTPPVSREEDQKKAAEKLRIGNDSIHVEAGYAYLFEKAPAAMCVSVDYRGIYNAQFYLASSDFWALGMAFGYRWGIPAGNTGFMPYIRFGFDYLYDQEYEDYQAKAWDAPGFPIMITGRVGLKITTSYVPGLFMGLAFQYNIFGFMDKEYDKGMKTSLSVTAGYTF